LPDAVPVCYEYPWNGWTFGGVVGMGGKLEMMWRLVAFVCLASLCLVALGCGSAKKTFTVYSWPPGARIFVDDDERGQTVGKVSLDFTNQPYATIWVKKEGMQPAGKLVDRNSPRTVSFVLEQAPDSELLKEIARSLRAIEKKLDK